MRDELEHHCGRIGTSLTISTLPCRYEAASVTPRGRGGRTLRFTSPYYILAWGLDPLQRRSACSSEDRASLTRGREEMQKTCQQRAPPLWSSALVCILATVTSCVNPVHASMNTPKQTLRELLLRTALRQALPYRHLGKWMIGALLGISQNVLTCVASLCLDESQKPSSS